MPVRSRRSLMLLATRAVLLLAGMSPLVDWLAGWWSVPDVRRPADVVVAFSSSRLSTCHLRPDWLPRERHAAGLVKQGYSRSGFLLLNGTYTGAGGPSPADCRKRLAAWLGLPASRILLDNSARTTADNARHTRTVMKARGWQSVLLVTSASHMRRARAALEGSTVRVFPVSVPDAPSTGGAWLHPVRMMHCHRLLYEYVALLKYKWYGYIENP